MTSDRSGGTSTSAIQPPGDHSQDQHADHGDGHDPAVGPHQLERGIAASVAAPKFYEAPRVTAIQDQGVGWGRRIDKVQTAFGTYCITYESNHGGDGRDVFKDALRPKVRNCPREK